MSDFEILENYIKEFEERYEERLKKKYLELEPHIFAYDDEHYIPNAKLLNNYKNIIYLMMDIIGDKYFDKTIVNLKICDSEKNMLYDDFFVDKEKVQGIIDKADALVLCNQSSGIEQLMVAGIVFKDQDFFALVEGYVYYYALKTDGRVEEPELIMDCYKPDTLEEAISRMDELVDKFNELDKTIN